MHIAFNGWFWDQPFTGSGQYLRQLIPALKQVDSSLKISLVVPDHVQVPESIPADVIRVKVRRGGFGKVIFEQQSYPAAVSRLKPDLAHVPYWGAPLSSSVPMIMTIHDVIPLSMPVYQQGFGPRLYTGLAVAGAK